MLNLLIVDDRDVFRDGLSCFLTKTTDTISIQEVSDGLEAVNLINHNKFDVVLMDIHMPFMDGIEATKNIMENNPGTNILAVSFAVMPDYIRAIMKAGASGFISKTDECINFIKAIETVASGKEFFPISITNQLSHPVLFN